MHADDCHGVLKVGHDEPFAHDLDLLDRLCRLWNDRLPVFRLRLSRVDCHQLPPWSLAVGHDPERRTVVAHEPVLRVELVQELDDRGARAGKILVEDAVLDQIFVRADDQILAILGDFPAHVPVRLVGAFVHEQVVRLCSAEFVQVDFMKSIGVLQFRAGHRLLEPAVEETLAILGPGWAREFDPPDQVGKILARGNVPHLQYIPIGACFRCAVSKVPAVLTDGVAGQRNRAVLGERIRIEKNARRPVEISGRVQDALILKTVVL